MRLLDANIFLRFLTRDDETKAQACSRLLHRLERGQEEASTCEAVLAEVVYVLESKAHYALAHHEISARLRPLLALRGFKLPNKRTYLRALDLYESHAFLDFEDAILAAQVERGLAEAIVSYDTDFDRVPGIVRLEPT